MDNIRIDKWLWTVRIFKTRSDAAQACKSGKVSIADQECKPSRLIKEGEIVKIKKLPVIYIYKILAIAPSRQPAKTVHLYAENLTSQEELDKLNVKNTTIFAQRDRGTGRPTKKDRRVLDNLINEFND